MGRIRVGSVVTVTELICHMREQTEGPESLLGMDKTQRVTEFSSTCGDCGGLLFVTNVKRFLIPLSRT